MPKRRKRCPQRKELKPFLPPSEWALLNTFSKGCDESLIRRCWTYEFSRNVDWIRDRYSKHELDPGFEHWFRISFNNPDDCFHVWLPPGFPEVPFSDLRDELQSEKEKLPSNYLWCGIPGIDNRAVFPLRPDDKEEYPNVYRLCIQWNKSPDAIVNEFRKFVHLKHDKSKVSEKRGVDRKQRLESNLTALGIWRLDSYYKGFMEAKRHFDKYNRKLPFSEPSLWSRKKKEASDIFLKFFLCKGKYFKKIDSMN